MADVPQAAADAAVTAALDAYNAWHAERGLMLPEPVHARFAAVLMLEAAAPLIAARAAAAEREREFVLVWRDERGEEITRSLPLRPGGTRIGIPLDAQHADLLEDGHG